MILNAISKMLPCAFTYESFVILSDWIFLCDGRLMHNAPRSGRVLIHGDRVRGGEREKNKHISFACMINASQNKVINALDEHWFR